MHIIALAYIDPGSGALLLQVIIAGAVSAIALFRNTLARFFARVLGRGKKKAQPEPTDRAS